MAFKIKDLMVNVLPSGTVAGGLTATRHPDCTPTEETWIQFLTFLTPLTGGDCLLSMMLCERTLPIGRARPQIRASAEALATLKEQLKLQLAEVEKQEVAAEENLHPKTVEEVDMLTEKLNDALEELKSRRAELVKKRKQ